MYVQKLMKDEIPFYTTEAVKDYHNEFVFCDIMAYARLAYGNHKRGDLQRILNRPSRYLKSDAFRSCTFNLTDMLACANSLSNASMARVNVMNLWADIELLSETTTPKDFVNRLYYGIGYKQSALSFADYCGKDKAETEELLNVLQKEAEDFATMDEWAAFAKEYSGKLQEKRKKKEGICLSTYHSSKGLEWEYVFLIDCNEDVTPFSKAETPEEIEEERRLFYVAFTRAKKGVSLSYINSTGTKKMFVSRFLQEMELTRSATVKNADGRSVDTDRARDLAKKKHPHYGSISPYPYSY
jgi:DNA helicase-2/ATP-dependent DNA helicase PcrA